MSERKGSVYPGPGSFGSGPGGWLAHLLRAPSWKPVLGPLASPLNPPPGVPGVAVLAPSLVLIPKALSMFV